MCLESSMALKQLSLSIKTMTKKSSHDTHIANSKAAVKSLNSLLQSSLWKETDLLSVIPAVTVASLLIDVVDCTEELADSVNVLATLINFDTSDDEKPPKEVSQSPTCQCVESNSMIENSHVVIIVEESMCDKCNKV